MRTTNRFALLAASLLAAAFSPPSWAADAAAPTTCKDGTTSTATGRGACSGHGGVQKSKAPATAAANPAAAASAAPSAPAAPAAAATQAPPAAAPGSKAPTVTASNSDPSGATAKCKDGTYSHSQHHSGTCSKHGGVEEWLKQ